MIPTEAGWREKLGLDTTFQPLDADLTAVAALAATAGMVSRTGADAFAVRTIAGTSPVQVANGSGSAGAPTISVDASTTLASGIVELATSAETITGTDTVRAVTPAGLAATYTAADVLAKLLTVDGSGSGLDADLLDGNSSAAFQPIDADLTAIAGLTATTNNFLVSVASAWASRTPAQALASLGYEAGIWTMAPGFTTPGTSSWSTASDTGVYIKFARQVWISGTLTTTPTIGTGSGSLQISGLPFTPDASSILGVGGTDANWTWSAGRTMLEGLVQSSITYILLRQSGSAVAVSNLSASNMATGLAHTVRVAGTYRVAS